MSEQATFGSTLVLFVRLVCDSNILMGASTATMNQMSGMVQSEGGPHPFLGQGVLPQPLGHLQKVQASGCSPQDQTALKGRGP